MNEENENLTDHEYDGIREYDNPLPNWWLVTFFATIIFGFIYWIHYEFGGAPTQQAELRSDLAQIEAQNEAQNKIDHRHQSTDNEDELTKLMNAVSAVAQGKEVFQAKCAACHGNELQGVIGPNLVDEYWLHGKGQLTEITGIIRNGVPEKGMPAWESLLKNEEIQVVAAYIGANRGTKPAHPKPPQGEKVVNY